MGKDAARPEDPLYGTTLGSAEDRSWDVETSSEIYLSARSRPNQIGPYRVLEVLGKGGMGVVYRARQHYPIERDVALKLLHPGHGDPQTALRFATEGQVLARMHHPGIAQVFDAGTTGAGGSGGDQQPFLVMELVEGEPLHRYCRRRRLGLEERLQLMIQVCGAINHAHQQGVIHRDLKPSNVLVVEEGGETQPARPKVIDFGIAKALDSAVEPGEALTRPDLVLGTPAYMSPEQARQEPADTRSDVYALGCLLYQLLVDEPPFDAPSLMEMFRKITEEPAPRPSVRLQRAERRPGPPFTAADLGDLDWIVLKALEKDPEGRYASAKELADDLRRFLEVRPVLARSPTASYQLSKLFRRHRGTMVAAGLVALALLLGTLGTAVGWVRSVRAEALAEREARSAQAVNSFLNQMLGSADPGREGKDVRVVEVLDKAAAGVAETLGSQPLVAAEVRRTLGKTYLHLGEANKAEAPLEAAYQVYGDTLGADARETLSTGLLRALAWRGQGKQGEVEEELRRLVARQQAALGATDPDTLHTEIELARLLNHDGDTKESAAILERALPALETVVRAEEAGLPNEAVDGRGVQGVLQAGSAVLGWVLLDQGRAAEAEALARRWVTTGIRSGQPDFMFYYILSAALSHQADLSGAEQALRDLLAAQTPLLGEEHPHTLDAVHNLATNLLQQFRLEEAEPLVRRTLEIRERVLGQDHPKTLSTLYALSTVVNSRSVGEDGQEALALAEEVHRRMAASLGEEHPYTLGGLDNRVVTLATHDRLREALVLVEEEVRLAREIFDEGAQWRLWTELRRLELWLEAGRAKEVRSRAEELLTERTRGPAGEAGPEHPDTLQLLSLKAQGEWRTGERETARETLRQATAGARGLLSEDPAAAWQPVPWVAEAAYLLGDAGTGRSLLLALQEGAVSPEQVHYGLWLPWREFFDEHPELEDEALLRRLAPTARATLDG